MLRNLLGPFDYLRIRHDFKFKVDWLVPIILTALSVATIFLLSQEQPVTIFGSNGMSGKILSFMQILPGFYIAALAAIATFQKNDIDQAMPSPAPTIALDIRGQRILAQLSRRRFLCSMFAFLTAESLLIIGICIFGELFSPAIYAMAPEKLHIWLKYTFSSILLLLCWQLIAATFWGLYYLGDRLHRE